MKTFIKLFSNKQNEINKFVNQFYISNNKIFQDISPDILELEIDFENPVEMSDMIGTFIENKENFEINMWICIDENILINVTSNNANDIIKYLYERFPY